MRIQPILAVLATALLVAAQTGCGVKLLSLSEEVALGSEAAPQLTQEYGGAVPDARLGNSLTRVGLSMTDTLDGDFRDLPWEFTLLNSPVINAFALPGGKVFVSRALIERMTNEAQLAGVLGHEIGHVTARHGNQKISASLIAQGVVVGAAVAVSGSDNDLLAAGVPLLVQAGSGSFLLKYGRDQELESDRLGMEYMTRVGYNPIGMRQTMEILAEAAGGSSPPEFFSTHPHPESRISQIDNLIETRYSNTQFNEQYQVYQARFNDEFLQPLGRIPQPQASRINLLAPETWCATCAVMEAEPVAAAN
ncbi:MAG: M48 family metalloprotease [Phycisphaerales bacterium]